MDHQNTHRHVSRRSERKPYQPRDSGYGGSNSDSDSDIARRSASLSLAAPDFAELSEYGIRDQEDDILERLATHYEPLEGHDLLVRAFERTITGTVRASYRDGVRIHEVVDQAIQPKFGITFLPGADSPQVNQMEEIGMSETKPDQKDSAWRVSSAGALLMDFDVGKDGLISFRDLTPNIVVSARRRCGLENESHNRSSSKALAIRNHYDRIVTIDSNNVKIVNDLATEPWDLDALLVEVDQSSLMALLLNYRQIINNRGQNLPYLETVSKSRFCNHLLIVNRSDYSIPWSKMPEGFAFVALFCSECQREDKSSHRKIHDMESILVPCSKQSQQVVVSKELFL